MKLLNHEYRELIYRNVAQPQRLKIPSKPTKRQIQILQSIITRRKMSKPFLEFIAECLFDTHDFSSFDYKMTYEFIHVLAFYKMAEERRDDNI